jgi:hypothetical protein
MKLFNIILIISHFSIYGSASESLKGYLTNKKFIENFLTKEAPWSKGHCADQNYLGAGMLYYAITYSHKAKLCVCLGSGGGFVPRIMKQAQRDLELKNSKTILVDGNMGNWGRPQWLEPKSFFRNEYPDISIIIDTTHNVATKLASTWGKINYLHIDADHSYEGALRDFYDYLPFMDPNGIITFHDTRGNLPCAKVIDLLKDKNFELIDLKYMGAGVAIIRPKK